MTNHVLCALGDCLAVFHLRMLLLATPAGTAIRFLSQYQSEITGPFGGYLKGKIVQYNLKTKTISQVGD